MRKWLTETCSIVTDNETATLHTNQQLLASTKDFIAQTAHQDLIMGAVRVYNLIKAARFVANDKKLPCTTSFGVRMWRDATPATDPADTCPPPPPTNPQMRQADGSIHTYEVSVPIGTKQTAGITRPVAFG
jgi:hypothetical protein